ncbi:MAG TPA: tetratricopeptide repeat protein, partial [Candidatus Synoicihabitans sp.]|nr:tetratricopeptide repeat protein [Candidatus Synoicihabitans sp.]
EKTLATLESHNPGTDRVGLLQAKADLLIARKQWPQARAQLQQLLQIEPLHGPALLSLGQVWLEENDLARAELTFTSASQIPESQYQAHLALANLALKSRRYEQAAGHLRSALAVERTEVIERLLTRVQTLNAAAADATP